MQDHIIGYIQLRNKVTKFKFIKEDTGFRFILRENAVTTS